MDLTQIIYALGLLVAIWWGGPDWRLSLACVANFIGTMALSASPLTVGVLDLVTIAVLVTLGTWRGYSMAAIFAVLVPIYPIGSYLAWPTHATYAIVDLLGYALLGVLASGSGGYRSKRRDKPRADGRGRAGVHPTVATRGYAHGDSHPHTQVYKPKIEAECVNLTESEGRNA